MADLTPQSNADLNKLAEIREKGGRLDALDEQRLRDHQLRRLRRLWLKDQIISPREPILPPKKSTWLSRLAEKEEAFWNRNLKFRLLSSYLYHGKDFHQFPLLWFYQSQRAIRQFVIYCAIPSLPVMYFLKYGGLNVPGATVWERPAVYPTDEYVTVRQGDVKFDRRTNQYVPVKYPDEWNHMLW